MQKPLRPFFSSGPCVKPKEWGWDGLKGAFLNRSHRSAEGVALISGITQSLRQLLEIPATHYVGLTSGSATGAIEMAMWNLLRPETPVDVLEWDIFSQLWGQAIEHELKLPLRRLRGPVPDVFDQLNPKHDCVLTWCGTTQGVWVGPNDGFLDAYKEGGGLVIVDAASAVLTTRLPWDKLDAVTFSWQKGLGTEAGFGVIVLGPRALERLTQYTPAWPMPRLLRLKDEHGLLPGIFQGEMINTCSMLLVHECGMLLEIWNKRGGLAAALAQTKRNMQVLESWVLGRSWIDFSVTQAAHRAHGPVVLVITDPRFQVLDVANQWALLNHLGAFLEEHQVGFDVVNHKRSFPSLRLWCGPAVETNDLVALLPWLDDGFQRVSERFYRDCVLPPLDLTEG